MSALTTASERIKLVWWNPKQLQVFMDSSRCRTNMVSTAGF